MQYGSHDGMLNPDIRPLQLITRHSSFHVPHPGSLSVDTNLRSSYFYPVSAGGRLVPVEEPQGITYS
jgi:hypothetical protein